MIKLIAILMVLSYSTALGQEEKKEPVFNLGLGYGIDYGGVIGIKASLITFTPQFELCAGLGYNLARFGWNAGLLLRTSPSRKVALLLNPMYGYNGVIISKNNSTVGNVKDGKIYYGPSVETGIELRFSPKGFLKLGIIIPFQSSGFKNDIVKYNATDPWPILPSIGWHFVFSK